MKEPKHLHPEANYMLLGATLNTLDTALLIAWHLWALKKPHN
jgi:hypothetical protein